MSGQESRVLGRWGERLAARFMEKKGYRVTEAGWRCRYGEIDLIAVSETDLVFVEVKLRRSAAFGTPASFVDSRKQQKLRTTAELYLAQNPTGLQPRFDVVEVYAPKGLATEEPEITHWENAF